MKAEELFKQEHFYKMSESHYINGITYIKTLDKEYEEISFLTNYEDSLNEEKILICLKNIEQLDENMIYAICSQLEEIKKILNEHPDWYLGTWFYRTWRKTDLGIGLVDESLHVVALFYPREECVPIDRADDLRWGLAKP